MSKIVLTEEGAKPSTPAAGKWDFYFKADGLYYLDDAGTEVGPVTAGTLLSKAAAADVATGTDDAKYVTSLAIKNSVNVPNVAPSTSGNVLTSNGTVWTSAAQDGWIPSTGTWSYSSADSPTFVISVNNDQTAIVGVGQRIKLTQATGGTKYFIVTAVGTYGAGVTLITVYGGTDYTLNNETISTPYHSSIKAPFGFPISPVKWSVTVTDASARAFTPTNNTWVVPTNSTANISIPIGVWNVCYKVGTEHATTGTTFISGYGSLSTSNNSESDASMTSNIYANASATVLNFPASASKLLTLTSKTTHYLIYKILCGGTPANTSGFSAGATITATCLYL